jgi:uncharacterized membrane protein
MNSKINNQLTWLLISIYFIFSAVKIFIGGISPSINIALNIGLLVSIAISHGKVQLGFKQLAIFFAIVFVISNAYENMSVMTGFPFGNYHHADSLGPKLFLIPIIIAPTYFVVGYFSWCLALILLDVFGNKLSEDRVWSVPLVAAFVMTMWDLQIDSISSTIDQGWFWHDGGSFFGVPFINYMGWLLCTYSFFQVFALYLKFNSAQEKNSQIIKFKSHWYQAIAIYAILSLPIMILPLIKSDVLVTDMSGTQWSSMDIYESMALLTIFTMWFVVLLCYLKIRVTNHK